VFSAIIWQKRCDKGAVHFYQQPMAAKASTAVGSAAWITSEKENVLQLLNQEKEEIVYPAQHEMDWLNEHMAEIFSRNQLYVYSVTL